jgi:hypothetical protein
MSVETWILSFLIAVVVAALLTYLIIFVAQVARPQETTNQAIVKHDWHPSGRIDFLCAARRT